MNIWRAILLGTILSVPSQFAFAHHPNEGSLTLEALVQEALSKNPEIRQADQAKSASTYAEKAEKGAFYPSLSVEGGPVAARHDSEKSSGTTVYGRAEWNLYRGGRDSASLEKARLEAALSGKQTSQTVRRIERDVARSYYEMLFLLETMFIKEKAVELNQEQMKLAQAKKASGFTSRADVIEFELRDATLRSDLKRLSFEKEDKSREISVLLGRAEPVSDLVVKGHLERQRVNLDEAATLKHVLEDSPEIYEAETQKQIVSTERDVVKSDFFPRVDFDGKFGRLADDTRVYSNKNNYTLAIKVSIPLFAGLSTRNQLDAVNARGESQDSALERRRLWLAAEAKSAIAQLSSILERLNLEEKTLSRSEEYYEITKGEYRRGVKNSPDMVGASEKLLDAKIRNLEFRRDFLLTKLKLNSLLGVGVDEISK